MAHTLYCITCSSNGKIYVGVTSRDLSVRWNEHLKSAKGQQRDFALHRAMRKHGLELFGIEPLFSYETEEEAAHAEIACIANLELMRRGYNAAPGGDLSPTRFVGHSPEARRKISDKARAQFASPEARRMLSERAKAQLSDPVMRERIASSLRGRSLPADVRAKIGAAHLGRRNTSATKAKMAASARARWARQREEASHAGT